MMYDLERFKKAQMRFYDTALREIKSEKKISHWMWFIFPQLKELGQSETSQYYGIDSLQEAMAYLADDILCNNLLEITNALLNTKSNNALQIFGYPDNLKLCSSMTLFKVTGYGFKKFDVFQKVIDKFFDGKDDETTLKILKF